MQLDPATRGGALQPARVMVVLGKLNQALEVLTGLITVRL